MHLEEGNVCEPVVANSVQLSFLLSFFSFSLSISLLSLVIEEGDVRFPAVADCVQLVRSHHCHPGLFDGCYGHGGGSYIISFYQVKKA